MRKIEIDKIEIDISQGSIPGTILNRSRITRTAAAPARLEQRQGDEQADGLFFNGCRGRDDATP